MTSTITKATIDSGANFSTITEEFANHLGCKINGENHESQNTNNVVSSIIKQVSDKKICISFHQLLEIVRHEIRQDIINAITNLSIAKQ